jgi:hypothetical protein
VSNERVKLYLDYLDKEMTIMGILSTFTVAATAAILNKLLSIDVGQLTLQAIWKHGSSYISFASVLMFLSALFFYRQRSRLAWHYGQICLHSQLESDSEPNIQLVEADSWEAWIPYRWAFCFLTLAALEYGAGLASASPSSIGSWLFDHRELCVIGLSVLLLLILLFIRRVLIRHRSDETPYLAYWKALRGNERRRKR